MRRIGGLLFAAAALLCAGEAYGQPSASVPDLEGNPEYAGLVSEEAALARTADSLAAAMENVRRAFRTDTLRRAANAESLLRMEDEMFGLRNRMARLTRRINAIEQEWILSNLEPAATASAATGSWAPAGPGNTAANLVRNPWFRDNLPPETYDELLRAQDLESELPALVADYAANNRTLEELRRAYDAEMSADAAHAIRKRFDSVASLNRSLENRAARDWETIFDSKSYSYSYLMDKNGREEMRRRFGEDLDEVRRREAGYEGRYASDAIVSYLLRKRLLTGYELLLADALGMEAAADSLKMALAALPSPENSGIERVELRERTFIAYSDIDTSGSPYNASNPIPEAEIYPKGIVYRVQLGTFSAPQSPSTFRGVWPLAVEKGPDGKYRYFAGAFRTAEEADKAVEQMSRRGFRQPHAAVWMDGVYINLTTGTSLGSGFFRVELWSGDELAPGIREIIGSDGAGRDILRAGDRFIVGPLDNARAAAKLRLALDGAEGLADIKLTEIEE